MPPQDTLITPAPQKIGKFKGSKMIVKQSFAVLNQDKEIMWFPILSGILCLIFFAVFIATIFLVALGGDISQLDTIKENNLDAITYAIMFVYYLVTFFIVNFFLAGIYTIVHGRFNGKNLTFRDGINGAIKNISKIFLWSLISATVGIVIRIIADRSKMVGQIVASLFGAAWNILTYFSLPSLIIGQTSIKDSFKESASIIRKTWGETIIVNLGVGLVFSLIYLLLIVLSIGVVVLIPKLTAIIIVGVLLVISLIALSIVSSALSSIFKLALYEYARTGNIPQGFSPELIQHAITSKK